MIHASKIALLALAVSAALTLGLGSMAIAQHSVPTAEDELLSIHGPHSIDQQMARLSEDLQLTPDQQKEILPLLKVHHDKIQTLFDKNPTMTREELRPQIHEIGYETHRQINALLTPYQLQLLQQMPHRG